MRRIALISLIALSLFVSAKAQTVIEKDITLRFEKNEAVVVLPVESDKTLKTSAAFKIVGSFDRLLGENSRPATLEPGVNQIELRTKMGEVRNIGDLVWKRLEYRVGEGTSAKKGIISLSEILRDAFTIDIGYPEYTASGASYIVQSTAKRIKDGSPLGNLQVTGILTLRHNSNRSKDLLLEASGITDNSGNVILVFNVPDLFDPLDGWSDNSELVVTGDFGGMHAIVEAEVGQLKNANNVVLTTDKQLYQPGQTVKIRGFAYSNDSGIGKRIPLGDIEIHYEIRDEDHKIVFAGTAKSSKFGITSVEWVVPDSQKLGEYSIRVDSDEIDEPRGYKSFKISRYELPNFVVSADPDKPYYLPTDKAAKVMIKADYLFGEKVAEGKVRVAKGGGRKWDFKKQEWKNKEVDPIKAKPVGNGFYTVDIDLKDHWEEFEEDSDLFSDLSYTAYFTDSSTNLTEQRQFDIRLSKSDIHLYVIGLRQFDDVTSRLPVEGIVSTVLADGTPIGANVEISQLLDGKTKGNTSKIRTSNQGLARFSLNLPDCQDKRGEYCYDKLELKFVASTGKKKSGSEIIDDIYIADALTHLTIHTDKKIYSKGESIHYEVRSNVPDLQATLLVSSGASVLENRFVKLKDGTFKGTIPFSKSFSGILHVGATCKRCDWRSTREGNVIFPKNVGLKITPKTDKQTYLPGTNSQIKYKVENADGNAEETAIGMFVVDRAVEERAIADQFRGNVRDALYEFKEMSYEIESFRGVSLRDLFELGRSVKADDDLHLIAALFDADRTMPYEFDDSSGQPTQMEYGAEMSQDVTSIITALKIRYAYDGFHPTTDTQLGYILKGNSIELGNVLDPWDRPYRASFSTERDQSVIRFISDGPDKKPGSDDLVASEFRVKYFEKTGRAMDRALEENLRINKEYVRSEQRLLEVLSAKGIGKEELIDPWGRPFVFEFKGDATDYLIEIRSLGPKPSSKYDDIDIWTYRVRFFNDYHSKLFKIWESLDIDSEKYPRSVREFKKAAKRLGVDFDKIRDGWGRKYYIEQREDTSYRDRHTYVIEQLPDQSTRRVLKIEPLTRKTISFSVRSTGEDGKVDKNSVYKNPIVFTYTFVLSEELVDPPDPKSKTGIATIGPFVAGKSSVQGLVKDSLGFGIPGAKVQLMQRQSSSAKEQETDSSGGFYFGRIAPGIYDVSASADGFLTTIRKSVAIATSETTVFDLVLEPGSISTVVNVMSGSETIVDIGDSMISNNFTKENVDSLPRGVTFASLLKIAPGVIAEPLGAGPNIDGASGSEKTFVVDFGKENSSKAPVDTPRVRKYFPETLLWAPEIVTDKDGNATVRFRLGDNLTTWRIYSVANNMNGEVGYSTDEIKTFKPFFADIIPPRNLTVGDQISLPVQIRNYTDSEMRVGVKFRNEDWFDSISGVSSSVPSSPVPSTPLGDSVALNVTTNVIGAGAATRGASADPSAGFVEKSVRARPDSTTNAYFGIRARSAVGNGLFHVEAFAPDDSDALEKPVTVSPDGRPVSFCETALFRDSAGFAVNFADSALSEGRKSELVIYPNLFSHVSESVGGLLKRPYGCGEQTISSTYPNLLILKIAGEDGPISKKAREYLAEGYSRLLGYQGEYGGFTYWGPKGKADVALTAYALRFLSDASKFIDVDESVMRQASRWLSSQQNADGTWGYQYDSKNTLLNLRTTAVAVRSLAGAGAAKGDRQEKLALETGLLRLRNDTEILRDPYALANLGLALAALDDSEGVERVADSLAKLALREGPGYYWSLESNTPFFGWGTAGRFETTGLALNLLQIASKGNPAYRNVISGGTEFLLKNKDRYGVWLSTQATINVLGALSSVIEGSNEDDGVKRFAEIVINDRQVEKLPLPPASETGSPLRFDVTSHLTPSNNTVEVRTTDGRTLQARLATSYYVDWDQSDSNGVNVNSSRAIRLDYACDRYSAKPTDKITCSVDAERVGFRGYGMLLAEIGTPPGADVDRASLDRARDLNLISRYDVLPDRIVVYMWARAGGTKFDFSFRPRFEINAQTPPSVLYDYYNEEAKAVLKPLRFVVRR
ncbi:MAG: alpha-2-macroglobulin family protein [Pyrinomonadaceae bacterium]